MARPKTNITQRALKELWELAKELEAKGNKELAEKLFKIHDDIRFHHHSSHQPDPAIFKGIPFETLERLHKILGGRGYDPRTTHTAIAIAIAKNGYKPMSIDQLSEQIKQPKTVIRKKLETAKRIFKEEKGKIRIDPIFEQVAKAILEGKKQ